jgi:hypothetical protein
VSPCLLAIGMATLTSIIQGGHLVSYKASEGTVSYRVRGAVVVHYAGGRVAPPRRAVSLEGEYLLETSVRDSGWLMTGRTRELNVKDDEKALSASEVLRVKGGKWSVGSGGSIHYTWNGQARVPFSLSAPLWPIFWRPIESKHGLKIGDVVDHVFPFPIQAFMEDDPIGELPLRVRLSFNGPKSMSIGSVWSFSYSTVETIKLPVNHPEAKDLRLEGEVRISGEVLLNRLDGKLESSTGTIQFQFALLSEKHPFGFSTSRGTVTTSLSRMR